MPYLDVKEAKLKAFLVRSLRIKGEGFDVTVLLTMEQVEQLKASLSTVAGLAGKVEVPS